MRNSKSTLSPPYRREADTSCKRFRFGLLVAAGLLLYHHQSIPCSGDMRVISVIVVSRSCRLCAKSEQKTRLYESVRPVTEDGVRMGCKVFCINWVVMLGEIQHNLCGAPTLRSRICSHANARASKNLSNDRLTPCIPRSSPQNLTLGISVEVL